MRWITPVPGVGAGWHIRNVVVVLVRLAGQTMLNRREMLLVRRRVRRLVNSMVVGQCRGANGVGVGIGARIVLADVVRNGEGAVPTLVQLDILAMHGAVLGHVLPLPPRDDIDDHGEDMRDESQHQECEERLVVAAHHDPRVVTPVVDVAGRRQDALQIGGQEPETSRPQAEEDEVEHQRERGR